MSFTFELLISTYSNNWKMLLDKKNINFYISLAFILFLIIRNYPDIVKDSHQIEEGNLLLRIILVYQMNKPY